MRMPSIEPALVKILDIQPGKTQKLGTGFFISEKHVLTAKHVVEKYRERNRLHIKPYSSHEPVAVDHIELHAGRDLALLTIAGLVAAPETLTLCNQEAIPESGSVAAWGFVLDSEKADKRTRPLIKSTEQYSALRFDGAIPLGFSGGPIVNEQGECIAMTYGKYEEGDCGYALPLSVIRTWLTELNIQIEKPLLHPWQEAYLRELIAQFCDLPTDTLLNQLVSGDLPSMQVRGLYVPLCVDIPVRHDPLHPERERKDQDLANNRQDTFPVIELLAQHPRIVLRGDPGCGKTTFTRYLALRLAARLLGEPLPNEREEALPNGLDYIFPIRIELDKLYPELAEALNSRRAQVTQMTNALTACLKGGFHELESIDNVLNNLSKTQTTLWILDGIDEIRIADAERNRFLELLGRWAQSLPVKTHRICITTRPYAYQHISINRFISRSIQPLQTERCFEFITRFCRHHGSYFNFSANLSDPEHAARQLIALLKAPDRKHLLEMCQNPLLLTLTTALYCQRGESALPKDRGSLYEHGINTVLKRWEDKLHQSDDEKYSIVEDNDVSRNTMREALNKLAYYAHRSLTGVETQDKYTGNITRALLEAHFCPFFEQQYSTDALLGYLNDKTGLIIHRGGGRYAFIHRTFREYLAARFIVANDSISVQRDFLHALQSDCGWWREVLALAARLSDSQLDENTTERLSDSQPDENTTALLRQCLPINHRECCENASAPETTQLVLTVANAEMERERSRLEISSRMAWRERLRQWQLAIIDHQDQPPQEAAEAGRYLSELGDPRPGVGVQKGTGLPDILWKEVPKGEVKLEGVYEPFVIKRPFKLAVYPITNSQFQAFIEHPQGYYHPGWWSGFENKRRQPEDWGWNESNHPKVAVNWYDAMAFCRWLDRQYQQMEMLPSGWEIRLPDEWEWQLAACSGQASFQYPWGKDYRQGYANIDETDKGQGSYRLARTTAVGIYLKGQSQQSIHDLIGNCWEWCRNKYDNPHGSWDEDFDDTRVLRGGAWDYPSGGARAAFRYYYSPFDRYSFVGFRVLCSPPS